MAIFDDKSWVDDIAHPSIEDLELFLTKRLSGQERDLIREHVIGCDECRQAITRRLAVKLGLLGLGPHGPIWLD